MTVKDLIEKLQSLDQELPVFVNGYEGGCDDLTDLKEIEVVRDVNSEKKWYYGSHEKIKDLHEDVIKMFAKKGKHPVKGVIFQAARNK
jgi:hypothetical protein